MATADRRTVGRADSEMLLEREAAVRTVAETLTPRELQVARLIAQGLPAKAVARHLAISYRTAKQHLHNVYAKLDVEGRVGLIQYMRRGEAAMQSSQAIQLDGGGREPA